MGLFDKLRGKKEYRDEGKMSEPEKIRSMADEAAYQHELRSADGRERKAWAKNKASTDARDRYTERYGERSSQRGRGGSFADRLKSGFEGAGGGMFGGSEKGGGFSNPFDKMGFGGSSSGRRGRGESGGIGGDALSVLGVGGGSSRHSGGRGTTIHVHVGGGGSGKKKRTHRRGGGSGGGGFSNPMSGLGF